MFKWGYIYYEIPGLIEKFVTYTKSLW
jgi:hypothetical protein